MKDSPQFRLAGEADAEVLLEFMRAYYAIDGHTFDRERARAALTALLRDPALGRTWLICDGDVAVGYIALCSGYSLEWLGRDAFVDEFFLLEPYRGRGWGRQTIAFVEGAARAAGIRTLHLEVVKQNAAALEIYRKMGFRDRASTLLSRRIAPSVSKRPGSRRN